MHIAVYAILAGSFTCGFVGYLHLCRKTCILFIPGVYVRYVKIRETGLQWNFEALDLMKSSAEFRA